MAVNLPIVVWLMRDYFVNIPLELEESARVDGASPYRVFWSIVLPLATPGLVATFLFVLVFAWNEYLLSLFLSKANAQTMPLLVAAQKRNARAAVVVHERVHPHHDYSGDYSSDCAGKVYLEGIIGRSCQRLTS